MLETVFNIHEAKTHLSRLIERAEAGETIIIAKAGKPKVRLSPVPSQPLPSPGRFAGEIRFHGDFDKALPPGEIAMWEGDAR